MMDARFEGIEDRLLPPVRVRPPLAADRRQRVQTPQVPEAVVASYSAATKKGQKAPSSQLVPQAYRSHYGRGKADSLAAKFKEENIRVSRSVMSTELRLAGLDDFITADEIATAIFRTGGCPADQIRVGPSRGWGHSGYRHEYFSRLIAIPASHEAPGMSGSTSGEHSRNRCLHLAEQDLAEFESFLAEVDTLIEWANPYQVLVAGDPNTKSTVRGSPATDARGEVVEEWLAAQGLVVLNQELANTCVRSQGGSIADVTFASAGLVRRVQGWEVLQGVETLSDHLYGRCHVAAHTAALNSPGRGPGELGPKWALKHSDRDAFVEAFLAWSSAPESIELEARVTRVLVVCRTRTPSNHVCDEQTPVHPLPETEAARRGGGVSSAYLVQGDEVGAEDSHLDSQAGQLGRAPTDS
ncbi:uncharacterized protein LOC113235973 [Hyposmocoma kahamanoa]|uniref:uncharacterized protein LOC113235973 n=1 Tax=Hyposmocoma kahamanoa TaxID=1477025 RepID=UPI000E6D7E76|nr:uncharacterized protein LOC113235973 [Hyposmocoma kahamanoa]